MSTEYFIALLSMSPPLPQLAAVKPDPALCAKLRGIYESFCEEDAVWVKTTEFKGGAVGGPPLATNHDVKAVEYFIKHKFNLLAAEGGVCASLLSVKEFVHFGLTSQDINNTCYPLMMLEYYQNEYLPVLIKIVTALDSFARKWKDIPLLARTHGQAASPTRMGKEFYVFVDRLKAQVEAIEMIPFNAKVLVLVCPSLAASPTCSHQSKRHEAQARSC